MTKYQSRQITLIAHNLRSCHNVGSLLRTAEGLSVEQVILSGYTPYPLLAEDPRLPYLARKINHQIEKTALGAETMINWHHEPDIFAVLDRLRSSGWQLVAIEQTIHSLSLPDFQPAQKIALLVGREVEGIEPEIIAALDASVEIPMLGKKESFNVVQAAAMALYHCRFR